MALRDILIIPDKILRDISTPLSDINGDTQILIDDMLETMYDAPGIGLAAIQIGVTQRVVVIDITKDEEETKNPLFLINPQITNYSDEESEFDEGCLSIPDYFETVTRPESITVEYLDRDGNSQKLDADGILARVIQHEVDHLDGKLFIDYLSKLKRDMVVKKFKKLQTARR